MSNTENIKSREFFFFWPIWSMEHILGQDKSSEQDENKFHSNIDSSEKKENYFAQIVQKKRWWEGEGI